ncbi:MAG: hypothetical protein AAFX50_02680, partial [Acidobacteriota bacterium]
MHRRFAPRIAVAFFLFMPFFWVPSLGAQVGIQGLDFEDLAKTAPGVGACTSSWSADDCYNHQLPTRPSHMRSQVVNKSPFSAIFGHEIDKSNVRWWGPPNTPSTSQRQTWQLGTRSSLDGRLNIMSYGWAGRLGVFYPENLDYGFQTKIDAAGNQLQVRGGEAGVMPWMRINDDTTLTNRQLQEHGTFYSSTGGTDLCSDGAASLPYPCTAYKSGDPNPNEREGSCYDIYVISSFAKAKIQIPIEKSEIRSTALTVFVENAERIPRANDGLSRVVWIYPRTAGDAAPVDAKGVKLLPDYQGYSAWSTFQTLTDEQEDDNLSTSPWWVATLMQDEHCQGVANPKKWCEFFDNQTYNASLQVDFETGDRLGTPTKFRPIELSTTGDGKVLIGHDARDGGIGFF